MEEKSFIKFNEFVIEILYSSRILHMLNPEVKEREKEKNYIITKTYYSSYYLQSGLLYN